MLAVARLAMQDSAMLNLTESGGLLPVEKAIFNEAARWGIPKDMRVNDVAELTADMESAA